MLNGDNGLVLAVITGTAVGLMAASYAAGNEAGKQWFADQLSYERATAEDKNAFTQCLLTQWERQEERIGGE